MADFPFLDLKRVYAAHKDAYETAALKCLEGGWYVLGEEVKTFESRFANHHQAAGATGVANGTDALVLALKAAGLKPGDAVITVSHTAIATIAAIRWAGYTPILVDIDRETFTMAPDSVEEALHTFGASHSIKALLPVHLYGHPAPMTELLALAEQHGLTVIEDCSQAHLASLNQRRVGSMGRYGCFSLYPTKNLGAFGDAGVITAAAESDLKTLQMLREYGWSKRYVSELEGYNSRLDELQAALLNVRIEHLQADTERRREIACRYDGALMKSKLQEPKVAADAYHVYHQYTVLSSDRDATRKALDDRGVPTGVLYPAAAHTQAPYADIPKVSLERTDYVLEHLFQLPIYPQITDDEVARVVDALYEVG